MVRSLIYSIVISFFIASTPSICGAPSTSGTPFGKGSINFLRAAITSLNFNPQSENYLFIPLNSPLTSEGFYLGLSNTVNSGYNYGGKVFPNFGSYGASIFSPRVGYKVGHYMPYVTVDVSENALKGNPKTSRPQARNLLVPGVRGNGGESIVPRLGLEKSFGAFKASIEYGFRRPQNSEDYDKSRGMSLNSSKGKTLHSFKVGFAYGF